MVVSLAAYVYVSIRTPEHEFQAWFAFVLFVADAAIANAIVPSPPTGLAVGEDVIKDFTHPHGIAQYSERIGLYTCSQIVNIGNDGYHAEKH